MEHMEEDYKAGTLSCRKSDAERLRRALEGLGEIPQTYFAIVSLYQCWMLADSVSLNLQDSQSQIALSQPSELTQTHHGLEQPVAAKLGTSPRRARSRSHDSDDDEERW